MELPDQANSRAVDQQRAGAEGICVRRRPRRGTGDAAAAGDPAAGLTAAPAKAGRAASPAAARRSRE
jgi:hypothetical protein